MFYSASIRLSGSALPEPPPAHRTLHFLPVLSLLLSQPLSAFRGLPKTSTLMCLSAGAPPHSPHLISTMLERGPEFKNQIRILYTSLFVSVTSDKFLNSLFPSVSNQGHPGQYSTQKYPTNRHFLPSAPFSKSPWHKGVLFPLLVQRFCDTGRILYLTMI